MQETDNKKKEGTVAAPAKRSRKRKKASPLYIIAMVVLLGVMGFSGFQIARQLLYYKQAEDTYNKLQEEVVAIAETAPASTFSRPSFDIPDVEPSRGVLPEPSAAATLPAGNETDAPSVPESRTETRPYHTAVVYTPSARPDETEEIQTTSDRAEEPSAEETVPEPTTQAMPVELPWLNIDFASLRAKNPQVVGWLQGMDGTINLPICQGTDNDYYLHHLIDGTYNFGGTLFVDYRNHFLQDDMSFIYGHKMKNGSMFAMIDLYDHYSYYRLHPYFRLYTPDAVYELYVMTSIYTSDAEPVQMNFGSNYVNQVNSYKNRGQYWTNITAQPGDKLVCLYTCAFHIEDGRLILICKAVRVA